MSVESAPNSLKSQRKSPTQGRSKTLVSSIFEAATRILPKTGYEGVTTNQLAKIAGVSVGSIYQYFANKDEIFALLLEKNLSETKALVEAVIRSRTATPLNELIAESVSTVVDLNLDNRDFVAKLFMQAPRLNRVTRIMESRDQFIVLLVEILKVRAHEIKPADAELAAYTIVHAVMGVIQGLVLHPPEKLDRAKVKSELTALALRYLCNSDTETPQTR